jgi:S1-C subfamily serine protease
MLAGETIEHPWLGVSGRDLTPALARERGTAVQSGVLVEESAAGSPAQAGGIRRGDILVSVDGQAVRSMDELGDRLDPAHRPGDTVVLGLARGAARLDIPVPLGAWPESLRATR